MKYKLCDDTWEQEEQEAVLKVLNSRQFTMGSYVRQYEETFADKFGTKYAVMVSSGSAANLLAVAALVYSDRLHRGDEVIVPAVSWSTTYFPLYQMGLKLKFVDINRETLNIDVEQMEEAISDTTKMVCLVNLLGNPNEFDKILSVCSQKNIIVMEDNCESLGAEYRGKQAGTFGDIGTYSTFYSHHLCTMEGGVVVTNNVELYHYMLCIRAHGWTRNLPADSTLYTKSENSFYESYNFIVPGYNLRPLEMEGAVGIEQLKKMDRIIKQRRDNAKYFRRKISEVPFVRIQREIGNSSWFGFAIVLENKYIGKRDEIVQKLMEGGIEVRPIVAGNFTRNKVIHYMNYTIHRNLEASNEIHNNGFFVGNHSKDNKRELDYFIDLLSKSLSEI